MYIMYFVKINTISESPKEGETPKEGMIYFSDLENPKNNLSTIIYSSDGVILGEYYKENRSDVTYSDLSPILVCVYCFLFIEFVCLLLIYKSNVLLFILYIIIFSLYNFFSIFF